MVHFSLKQYPQLKDGSVYIFGKLTDWKFKDEFKMNYDTLNNKYYKEVLLKQGYYNYMYCVVKDGSKNKGDLKILKKVILHEKRVSRNEALFFS